MEFDNELLYTKDTFIRRSLSSSCSLKEEDKNYKEYINDLENIFDNYAEANMLSMKNKTVVYIGKVK